MGTKKTIIKALCSALAAASLVITAPVQAAATLKGGVPLDTTGSVTTQTKWVNRIIVELANPLVRALPLSQLTGVIATLASDAGFQLKPLFRLTDRFMVLQVPTARSASDIDAIVSRLKASKLVYNVEADHVIHTFGGETHYNDAGWPSLYKFYQATNEDAYTRAHVYNPNLYELTVAAESAALSKVRVAVIDSGLSPDQTDMPSSRFYDLKTILQGKMSDGAAEVNSFSHGTSISGIIGAPANNSIGMAGLAPGVGLAMYKVFDDQGNGIQSDAELAALYAANLHDRTVIPQDNPTPANVINMSLGANIPCGTSSQDVYDKIANAGIIVVAAAGNSSLNAQATPAACNGVVGVGAANSKGERTFYSNADSKLIVSTYGGDQAVGNLFPTLGSKGTETSQGTSNASPVVASVMAFAKAYDATTNYTKASAALVSTGDAFASQDPNCAGKTACSVLMNTQAFLKQATGVDVVAVANGTAGTDTGTGTGTGSGSTDTGTGTGTGSGSTDAGTGTGTGSGSTDTGTGTGTGSGSTDTGTGTGTGSGSTDTGTGGGAKPAATEYRQQDSSVATGKSNPAIRRADGAALNGASVSIANDEVVVSMTDPGEYFVYYDGNPVTTGTTTYATNRYGFRTLLNQDGSTQGGQTVQVQSDQTAPPAITPTATPTQSPSAPTSGGGGGGGGSMSLYGIVAMFMLLAVMKRKPRKA